MPLHTKLPEGLKEVDVIVSVSSKVLGIPIACHYVLTATRLQEVGRQSDSQEPRTKNIPH